MDTIQREKIEKIKAICRTLTMVKLTDKETLEMLKMLDDELYYYKMHEALKGISTGNIDIRVGHS